METFDWNTCKYNPQHKAWLQNNQWFPIGEDAYVSAMRALRTNRNASVSHMKKEYRSLKERFGFFPGS